MTINEGGIIKTLLGSMIKEAAKSKKYRRKNKFEVIPPVENIKRRRIIFRIKKLRGPPKLRFCLFLIEINRNMKTKKPINGTPYWAT